MTTQDFEYQCAGTTARGLLSLPEVGLGENDRYPGVVICHAWKGPGSFERERAEELAEMGFAVLVADVYAGQRGNNNDEATALMTPLVEDRGGVLKDRLHASVEALQNHAQVDASRCAAIGYCFGGLCALDLARSGADLRAVVSFHGLLGGHEFGPDAKPLASILACHGWDDPMATPEAVVEFGAEMTKMGADWQLHGYGNAMHAFTNPAANDPSFGTVYDATADARSFRSMVDFLFEHLEVDDE